MTEYSGIKVGRCWQNARHSLVEVQKIFRLTSMKVVESIAIYRMIGELVAPSLAPPCRIEIGSWITG